MVTLNILPDPADQGKLEDALKNLKDAVAAPLQITLPNSRDVTVDPDSFETIFELVTPQTGELEESTISFSNLIW